MHNSHTTGASVKRRVLVPASLAAAVALGGLVLPATSALAADAVPVYALGNVVASISPDTNAAGGTAALAITYTNTNTNTSNDGATVPSDIALAAHTVVTLTSATGTVLKSSMITPGAGSTIADAGADDNKLELTLPNVTIPVATEDAPSTTVSDSFSINTSTPATPTSVAVPAFLGGVTADVTVYNSLGQIILPAAYTNDATVLRTAAKTTFTAPPAAVMYQPYSAQLANLVEGSTATFALYTNYGESTPETVASVPGFTFSPTTGKLTAAAPTDVAVDPAVYTMTVTETAEDDSTLFSSISFSIPVLFSDVAVKSTFGTAIYELADQGIINGYADGMFRPATTVTRQAFVHFAAEYLGYTTGPCTSDLVSGYSDVANTSLFCGEIQTLSTMGIIQGYSDGMFRPSAPVSRQAIAAFMYRVDVTDKGLDANSQAYPATTTSSFSDVKADNQFAGAIEWMNTNKIAKGYSDGTFLPTATSSRQAAAQLFYNLEVYAGYITLP